METRIAFQGFYHSIHERIIKELYRMPGGFEKPVSVTPSEILKHVNDALGAENHPHISHKDLAHSINRVFKTQSKLIRAGEEVKRAYNLIYIGKPATNDYRARSLANL